MIIDWLIDWLLTLVYVCKHGPILVFQLFLSWENSIPSSIFLMFICFNCFSIVFMRFVLGLPLGFVVCLIASYNATLADAFSSNLAIWPKNRSLRCDIILDHLFCLVFSYSSSLLIQLFLCQLIPNMFLRSFLWKTLILFSWFLFNPQHSLLYRNTLSSSALKILIFRLTLIFLLWKMVFRLLYAPQVSPILLFISSSVFNRLPTYLHFFQFSDPSLLMLNFSVFASFTNKISAF